jgi:hypothetical protein
MVVSGTSDENESIFEIKLWTTKVCTSDFLLVKFLNAPYCRTQPCRFRKFLSSYESCTVYGLHGGISLAASLLYSFNMLSLEYLVDSVLVISNNTI